MEVTDSLKGFGRSTVRGTSEYQRSQCQRDPHLSPVIPFGWPSPLYMLVASCGAMSFSRDVAVPWRIRRPQRSWLHPWGSMACTNRLCLLVLSSQEASFPEGEMNTLGSSKSPCQVSGYLLWALYFIICSPQALFLVGSLKERVSSHPLGGHGWRSMHC